jgi:hypothetical protein
MNAITEIDTTIGRTGNGGPRITRTYHCGPFTVRARVARDSHLDQSYAVAEVLTPALAWTTLCEQPPEHFHDRTFPGRAWEAALQEFLLNLAEELAGRACRILRAPTD